MIAFAHPWFLLFLPLAAGPVLLHLLSRRKLKRMEFSSLFFLRRMRERRFRWLRLRDMVLLVLRTLFLLAILLALAGPSLQLRLALGRERADLIIILDDSYSTSARFETLKNTALRLVRGLSPGSRAALITPSGGAWDSTWSDAASVAARIARLEVSGSGRDLKDSWDKAIGLLGKSSGPKRRLALISDGQEHALAFLKNARPAGDIEALCFIDDGPPPPNTSVLDAALSPEFPLPGEQRVLRVRLSRIGGKDEVKLRIESNGRQIEEREVGMAGESLAPENRLKGWEGTEKTVSFYVPETAGDMSVSIDADSIPGDNSRFVLSPGKGTTRVALVGKTDSELLGLALDALGGVEVNDISQQSASSLTDAGCDLLIWDGAQGLPDQALAPARGGVPVLLFLEGGGEKVSGAPDAGPEHVVAGFETIRGNSFFSPIEDSALAQVKIFSYVALKPQGASVIAAFSSGKPFILRDSALNITYVTTRFTPAYTDMVYKGLFPVFLQRIISFAEAGKLDRTFYVGDTLSVKFQSPAPVVIETPSVQYEMIPLATDRGYLVSFTSTGVPGFYKIGRERFAVNPDPAEASPAKINKPELRRRGIGVFPLETSAPRSLTLFLLILGALAIAAEFIIVLL